MYDGGRTALRVPRAGAHARGSCAARQLVKEGPPRSQKAKVRWLDGEYREVIALHQEVDRLQDILKDLARWLRSAGHPQ